MKNKLKIFNSFTKSLEYFEPIDPNNVKIYICGPTVYNSSHIGHGRTYVMFDVIRNILEKYYNYNVTFVMNITDIDDKIINTSKEGNISTREITEKYTKEFLDDMKSLNVRYPDVITKVTDYIKKIQEFIDKLLENGFAYKSNGSVYFDLEKYKRSYDHNVFKDIDLEGLNISDASIAMEKKNSFDFALWKAADKNDIGWDYKGMYGRPGWHIECSAMASDVLGEKIDIHAGGIDLRFPHHANEIAQCQAYFEDSPWIKYFLHTGHLNINSLKMSKSLKNFTTIQEIIKTSSPIQLRILFLYHQWNKDMNYENEELKFAGSAEKKLKNFVLYADSLRYDAYEDSEINKEDSSDPWSSTNDKNVFVKLNEVKSTIDSSFANNFDTSSVIKSVLDLVTFTNSRLKLVSKLTVLSVKEYVNYILNILGIEFQTETNNEDVTSLARMLNDFRNEIRSLAKKGKEYKVLYSLCDRIRSDLKEHGFVIEDDGETSVIKKL